MPKSKLEQIFGIRLTVDDSLNLAEIKLAQGALYSQLDPSLWLPEDQLPSFLKKDNIKYHLKQQSLYLDESVFSRIVYTIHEKQLILIYLQLLPDNCITERYCFLYQNDFKTLLPECLSYSLNMLNEYARILGIESITTDIYNPLLLTIFYSSGYEKIHSLKNNSPVTPHTTLRLLINAG